MRRLGQLLFQGIDLVLAQEGEKLEELDHISVIGVEEELIKGIGRRDVRVQIDGTLLALAELLARCRGDQREGQGKHLLLNAVLLGAFLAHQLAARGDIAPLVAAADLQPAPLGLEEVVVVVALEDHVAELGIGDAHVVAVDAALDRLLLKHPVDREILAHVTQQLDGGQVLGPDIIVGDLRTVAGVALEEAAHLALDLFGADIEVLTAGKLAFLVLARRIADEPGGAAHEEDGIVSGALHAGKTQERDEVADVQAFGGGVEPAIHGRALLGQVVAHLLLVRNLIDQTTPLQFVVNVHRFLIVSVRISLSVRVRAAYSCRNGAMETALPVVSSMSKTAPCKTPLPGATSSTPGRPVR